MSTTPNAIQGLPDGAVLKPIGSATQPPIDSSQIQGLPAGATLKPIAGATDTTSTAPTPSTRDQILQAERTPFKPAAPVEPPHDHKEEIVKTLSGDSGLSAYRGARETLFKVETLLKSPSEAYDAAKQTVVDHFKSAYAPEPQDLDPTHHVMNQNPIFPGPGVAAAGEKYLASEAVAPTTRLTNPFIKKLIQSPKEAGVAATQEPAASAVRTVTGAPASTPIVSRAAGTTAADDMISKSGAAKDAAYKQIDTTVGFDRKDALKQLKDAQYAIKQPGADVARIQKDIDTLTPKLADADAKLAQAKIDPKGADRLNTTWEATKSFKNDLVQATKPNGDIDVNTLLKRTNSRFNPKYGDRLAQAFGKGDSAVGKPIADAYVKGLEAAQKAGVTAVKTQELIHFVASITAKTIGYGAVGAAAGAAGYAGVKWWLGS